MKFSIVIPTWEQYGNGVLFLTQLLTTIRNQTIKDYEVIISDHSIDSEIKSILNNFNDLNIIYTKNEISRGNSPANLNNGLRLAKGDIIKIMFQDDFFINNNALEIIQNHFEKNSCSWVVNGCCHTTDGINYNRYMVPHWNDRILDGVNTISSPSVLSFINQDILFFDEELTMLMDCDYYHSLYIRYGLPLIIEDYLITNRLHKHQISNMYNKNLKDEINIVKNKNYEFRK
jgi:glycosyltransferase involved in cell wall biosynthesis